MTLDHGSHRRIDSKGHPSFDARLTVQTKLKGLPLLANNNNRDANYVYTILRAKESLAIALNFPIHPPQTCSVRISLVFCQTS